MPDNQDKIKLLYDAVSRDYNLGTFDEFKTKMSDSTKRKAFYDGVGAEYNLGTFEEFNNKISAPITTAVAAPIVPPVNKYKKAVEDDRSEFGKTLSSFYNGIVGSLERLGGGVMEAVTQFTPSPYLGALPAPVKMAVAAEGKKGIAKAADVIRSGYTTREEEKAIAGKFDITNGIGADDFKALATMSGGMAVDMVLGGLTGGASFAVQGFNDGIESYDEAIKNTGLAPDPTARAVFGTTVGVINGVLEKYALDKMFGDGPAFKAVQRKVIADVLKQTAKQPGKVAVNTIEKIADAEIKKLTSGVKAGIKRGLSRAAIEGSTEAIQTSLEEGAKFVTNSIQNGEVFDEKDIINNLRSNIINSAAAGVVFGPTFGLGFDKIVGRRINKDVLNDVANAKTPEDFQRINDELETAFNENNFSQEERDLVMNNARRYAEIKQTLPQDASQEAQVKAIPLIESRISIDNDIQNRKNLINTIDESLREDEQKSISLLEDKRSQINDEIREAIAGEQFTYFEENGKYFKKFGEAEPEEISRNRYDLEQIKRGQYATTESEGQIKEGVAAGDIRQRQRAQEGIPQEKADETDIGYRYIVGEEGDEIPVAALLNKKVRVNGQPAILYQQGQTVEARIIGTNRIIEIGNVNKLMNELPEAYNIELDEVLVTETPQGYRIEGQSLQNTNENPLDAISFDSNGNVMNVVLTTPAGKRRKFRGQVAKDLAYQIQLKEILKDEQEFENFLEREHQQELENARLQAVAEEQAAGDTEAVPAVEAEPTPAAAVVPVEPRYGRVTVDKPVTGIRGPRLKRKAVNDANRVVASIRSVVSKMTGRMPEINLHDQATFEEAVVAAGASREDATARGFYLGTDGTIHINLDNVASDTVLHEGFHPILDFLQSRNPEVINKYFAELESIPEAAPFIKDAIDNYIGDVTQKKEAITSFVAGIANGDVIINPSNFQKIRDFILNMLNKLGMDLGRPALLNVQNEGDLVKLAKYITEVFERGEAVTTERLGDFIAQNREAASNINTESSIQFQKDNPVFFSNIKEFADKSAFKNKLEFKNAIQDIFQSNLAQLKNKYGKSLDTNSFNEITKKYLSDFVTDEARLAIKEHPEAIGWYDEKTRGALNVVSVLHPEIATDVDSRAAFILPLAVMSNGNLVDTNFDLAEKQYTYFKENGRYQPNGNYGIQQSGIKKTLKLINTILNSGVSIRELTNFLTSKHRAGDLKINLNGKNKNLVSGELADEMVYGAVILGPKIGNGFYMNLWGQFDQLTMDRWFMRTWGRATGSLIKIDKDNIKKAKARLVDAIAKAKSDNDASVIFKNTIGPISKLPIQEVAKKIEKASMKKDIRQKLSSNDITDEIRRAGIGLSKALTGEIEAPQGGKQRKFIRDVFIDVKDRLLKEDGVDISMADLQAVLWYPEKILYESFKEGKTFEEISEGYTEESAPDYLNAAKKLVKKQGISDENINQALSAGRRGIAGVERPRVGGVGAGTQITDTEVSRVKGAIAGQPQFQRTAPNGKPSNLNAKQYEQVRTPAFKNWFGDWENDPDNASKVVDENGEPLVVYHGSASDDIEIFDRQKARRVSSGLLEFGTYFTNNKELAKLYASAPLSEDSKNDIIKRISKLDKQLDKVRNIREYENIISEIDALENKLKGRGGKIYEVFLNLRKVKEFDGKGESGVSAWRNLRVDAGYKIANNRDAMLFLKEGKFGVEKVDGVVANNISDVSEFATEETKKKTIGTVYLVFDGDANKIKSATENTGDFSIKDNRIQFQRVAGAVNVAPLFSTKVTSIEEAKQIQSSDMYSKYRAVNEENAKLFNLSVDSQVDGIGGFDGVSEVTTVVNLTGEFNDIVNYSAIQGALAPEVQEATIAGMYVEAKSKEHNADKYIVGIDNQDAAIKAAQDAGFQNDGYTLLDDNISFFNVFKYPTKGFGVKLINFIKKYQDYGGKITYKKRQAVRSEYIDASRRKEILSGIEKSTVRQGEYRERLLDALKLAQERNDAFLRAKGVQFQKGISANAKKRFEDAKVKLKKNFNPYGILGKDVKILQEKMSGALKADLATAERNVSNLLALKEKYSGVVSLSDMEAVMTGQAPANSLPADLSSAISEAREHIDTLTEQLIESGVIDDQETIDYYRANKGKYLLRSYESITFKDDAVSSALYGKGLNLDNVAKKLRNVDQGVVDSALKYLANRARLIDSINWSINKDGTYNIEFIKYDKVQYSEQGLSKEQLAESIGADNANIIIDYNIDRKKVVRRGTLTRFSKDVNKDEQVVKMPNTIYNKNISIAQSEIQARKDANEILSDAESYVTRGLTGSTNVKSLSQRLDEDVLSPEIRALMGEYKDPIYNYYSSIFKISSLASSRNYLNQLRSQGLGRFLFEKGDANRPDNATTPIAAAGSETLAPLNGLYTYPEFAEALKQAEREKATTIESMAGRVRKFKTVYNPATHIKNLIGNMGFAVSNGHWNYAADTFKYIRQIMAGKQTPELLELLDVLNRQGVLNSSVGLNELRSYFDRHEDVNSLLEFIYDKGNKEASAYIKYRGVKANLNKIPRAIEKAYGMEDDVFKLLGFVNEANRYAQVKYSKNYFELNDSQKKVIREQAAEIVKNTYPTFSRVPTFVRRLSKTMFLGNFLSFPVESVRVSYNTLKLAMKEINSGNPKLRNIGMTRLAGTLIYNSLFSTASVYGFMAAKAGLTGMLGFVGGDDEEENDVYQAILNYLAPWTQKKDIYVHKFGDGKLIYSDIGSLDSYSYQKSVWNAFWQNINNDKGFIEAIGKSIYQGIEPFVQLDLFYDNILNVFKNEDRYGNNIYNPEENRLDKTKDIGAYMAKQLGPGVVSAMMKSYEYYDKGDFEKLQSELVSQFGARTYYTDLEKQFKNHIYAETSNGVDSRIGFKNRLSNARSIYENAKRSGAKGAELDSKYEEALKAYKEILKEVESDYRAAIKGGVPERNLRMILNKSRLGETDIDVISILNGKYDFNDNAYIKK